MKNTKKLLSLLLVFVMTLTLANGFTAKAAAAITVTLRIEQDETTLLAPVQVTLTDEDKNNDFGIDLLTTGENATLSPLRALCKYLSTVKSVKDEDMKNYIIVEESDYGSYVNGLSVTGDGVGAASTAGADSVSWMYDVNDTLGDVAMDQYELKDKDSVVFYGLWYSYEGDETLYASFNQNQYTAELKNAKATLPVSLNGSGVAYDADWNPVSYTKPISGATIYIAEYQDSNSYATEKNAVSTIVTDHDGKASLSFTKAGTYVLSASRKAADGIHYDISRPYAVVKVTEEKSNSVTTSTTDSNTDLTTTPSIKKVTKVKATVKKTAKKKKTVKLSWKKLSRVTGYQVTLSKKKAKGYKKIATVKKNKTTFKKKKGTYYVKVRAYQKQGGKTYYGKYSKALKIKVK